MPYWLFKRSANPFLKSTPISSKSTECLFTNSLKNTDKKWENIIGSEIFIIVAFKCNDNNMPDFFALSISLAKEIESAKKSGILLSLHLKATMMKISDPIIFSHFLSVFFKELVNKHSVLFEEIGVDFKNGFADLLNNQ